MTPGRKLTRQDPASDSRVYKAAESPETYLGITPFDVIRIVANRAANPANKPRGSEVELVDNDKNHFHNKSHLPVEHDGQRILSEWIFEQLNEIEAYCTHQWNIDLVRVGFARDTIHQSNSYQTISDRYRNED